MNGTPQIRMSACPRTLTAVLLEAAREDLLVHRLGLAGVARRSAGTARGSSGTACACAAAGILPSVQRMASNFRRSISVNSSSFFDRNAVAPGEHAVVERRLDVEDVHVLVDDRAHALDLGRQHRLLRIHVAVRRRGSSPARGAGAGSRSRTGRRSPTCGRRPWDEVDVDVDDEIALDRAAVDVHRLAVVGVARGAPSRRDPRRRGCSSGRDRRRRGSSRPPSASSRPRSSSGAASWRR